MTKKKMSFWQMFNLNFGFLGIQFGWALQMANMSGIYKFLGADNANMGYLWLAAPLSGMLIQPILGQISDKTWTRIGRRRPYILLGAGLSTLALILMPNSTSLWFAAILLWVLDGSLNIAMQPYRALVADVAPKSQHTICYTVQTCLVGVGSTLAYVLPWVFIHVFNISASSTGLGVPLSLKLSFYIGAVVFFFTNIWTVFTSQEYPPDESELCAGKKKYSCLTNALSDNAKSMWHDFRKMPKIMREIFVVQFFTWVGLFCVFLYLGIAIAQNIFGLPAGADLTKTPALRSTLEQGIALGGICSAIYTFVSIIYSALIPKLSDKITRKNTHAISLFLAAVGLLICVYATRDYHLFIGMIGLGAAWASIVTVPYAILAGSLPKQKMGLYMGLINIAICIPEILAALTFGVIVGRFFHDHAMTVILMGAVMFMLAAISTVFVHDIEI